MTNIRSSHVAIIAGLIILVAFFVFWQSTPQGGSVQEEGTATTTNASSTVQTGSSDTPPPSPPQKEKLPPEPTFVLPEGATNLDEYAFVDTGTIYFRSLVSTTTHLKVPGADPASFRRLQDLSVFPGSEVIRDCGAAPRYTFYVDKRQPYFYQIWRAPEFRSSQIDAMVGADADSFVVTGATTAQDDQTRFDMTYKKATSTCVLLLNQAPL